MSNEGESVQSQPARSVIRGFQIFRTGEHVDAGGRKLAFDEAALKLIAESYDPRKKSAPLVLGHPSDQEAAPSGNVIAVVLVRQRLFCLAEVGQELVAAVRQGRYRKVSSSFYLAGQAGNPNRNDARFGSAMYLRHVGFLGAMPPAVKGMEPLAFSCEGTAAPFALDREESRTPRQFARDRLLHRGSAEFSESNPAQIAILDIWSMLPGYVDLTTVEQACERALLRVNARRR